MPRISGTYDLKPLDKDVDRNMKLADEMIHYVMGGSIVILALALIYLLIKRSSKM
jgi:hypothetical protein